MYSGITLASLPVKRGYFRLTNTSIDVRRCPDAAVNCNDSPECPESNSGCRGTVEASRRSSQNESSAGDTSLGGCGPSLTGPLCLLCSHSVEGSHVYYMRATTSRIARCEECRNLARNSILLAAGVLAGLCLVLFLVQSLGMVPSQLHSDVWTKFRPHVKLKIVIGFYLIATKVDDVVSHDLV